MRRFLSALVLGLAFLTAGCGKNNNAVSIKAGAAERPSAAVPLAMLPRAMVPTRYRIALRIDPARPGFSGHTEIDVTVTQPQRSFYIHGLGLHVALATARLRSGEVLHGTYTPVHESGVASLSFPRKL